MLLPCIMRGDPVREFQYLGQSVFVCLAKELHPRERVSIAHDRQDPCRQDIGQVMFDGVTLPVIRYLCQQL